jgi:hypothetical protein
LICSRKQRSLKRIALPQGRVRRTSIQGTEHECPKSADVPIYANVYSSCIYKGCP